MMMAFRFYFWFILTFWCALWSCAHIWLVIRITSRGARMPLFTDGDANLRVPPGPAGFAHTRTHMRYGMV